MQYVIIGCGSRGMTYGQWAMEHGIQIAAIAECRPDRLENAANELGVPLTDGYNGNLTSKQNGSVGGYMVNKMIEAQERQMSQGMGGQSQM